MKLVTRTIAGPVLKLRCLCGHPLTVCDDAGSLDCERCEAHERWERIKDIRRAFHCVRYIQ